LDDEADNIACAVMSVFLFYVIRITTNAKKPTF
jgi:hypothetical protein